MKKLLKRFGAAFVIVAMLVAMIPMTVFAADPEYKINGQLVKINDEFKGDESNYFTLMKNGSSNYFELKCKDETTSVVKTSGAVNKKYMGYELGVHIRDLELSTGYGNNYYAVTDMKTSGTSRPATNPSLTLTQIKFYVGNNELEVNDIVSASNKITFKTSSTDSIKHNFYVSVSTGDKQEFPTNSDTKSYKVTAISGKTVTLTELKNGFYAGDDKLTDDEIGEAVASNKVLTYYVEDEKQPFNAVYEVNGVAGDPVPAGENKEITVSELGVGTTDVVTIKSLNTDETPTITLEKKTGGYVNGAPYVTTPTKQVVNVGDTITFYGSNGEELSFNVYYGDSKKKNNVSSYDVELKYNWSKFTVEFDETNKKVTLSDALPTVKTAPAYVEGPLTYSGSEKEIFTTGEYNNGTLWYAVTTGTDTPNLGDWTTDATTLKQEDADTYYVWYFVKGGIGYADIPAQKIGGDDDEGITIDPMEVTIPTVKKSVEYNGQEQTIFTDSSDAYDVKTGGAVTGKDVQDKPYEFTLELTSKTNYVWDDGTTKDKTFTWNITKKDLAKDDFEITLPKEEDLGYDALGKKATVEVKDEKLEPVVEVLYQKGNDEPVKEAYLPGTYKVLVKVSGKNFEKETIEAGSFTIADVKVVAGDKGKFTEGSDGTLTFKANGPFNEEAFKDVKTRTTSRYFNGIEVDGYSVDPKAYTVKEGSTVVTLSNDYLKTLRAGKHTITFAYDGDNVTAEATFTVEATAAPKTADTNTTWLWILLSVLGGLALIAGAYKVVGSDI